MIRARARPGWKSWVILTGVVVLVACASAGWAGYAQATHDLRQYREASDDHLIKVLLESQDSEQVRDAAIIVGRRGKRIVEALVKIKERGGRPGEAASAVLDRLLERMKGEGR